MKGQYLVIQFLLFFLIGLSVFLALGNIFRYQADVFGSNVADSYRKLLNTYISSAIIYGFNNCKQCDVIKITIKVKNETAEYFYEIHYTSAGLNVISQPGGKNFLSSVHNLNSTLSPAGTFATSVNPIILTVNKTNNILEVK
jgi:thioredoxin-related protein